MAIRLSGMTSGLDTDSIVEALVSSYTTKKQKYEKAQTKLSWKQDTWKSLNTKVYSLYSNVSNLRFSSAYSLKKASVSDTTKATVSASSTSPNGTQTLKIKNTATSGYLTGEKINANSTSTTLAQLGYTGGDAKINVTTGSGTSTISLSSTSTIADVTNQLKSAGLNASYDTTYKRFYISSKDTGVENDFTLTGADSNGASALYKLGIAVGGADESDNPYSVYDSLYGEDSSGDSSTQGKIEAAVSTYKTASKQVASYNAQSDNLLSAISYSGAYSKVQDFYANHSDIDSTKLETLANLNSRDTSLIADNGDGTYTTYSKTTSTDADGNAVYKSSDNQYISVEERYEKDGVTYKKNSDGTYVNVDDAEDKYSGDTADLTKKLTYRSVSEKTSYVSTTGEGDDAVETSYSYDEENDTYTSTDGKVYSKADDGKYYAEDDTEQKNAVTITKKTEYISDAASLSNVESASDAYKTITTDIDEDDLKTYTSNLSTVNSFEKKTDSVLSDDDAYSIKSLTAAVHKAYATGASDGTGGAEAVSALIAGNGDDSASYVSVISDLATKTTEAQATIDDNKLVKSLASIEDTTSEEYQKALANLVDTVNNAHELSSTASYNSGASKVSGTDAQIELNGVEYTGASNSFTINGLTINALASTGDEAISITTSTDTQGIYDKIKDFLTEYNNIINEMTELYNADSAKDYEPLTDDEKEEMTDSEIEKWETKIKDSLLRNDSTLNSIMTTMQNAMTSAIEINGKKYSLSSFGIHTLGYLNAAENEQNAYHIDGDEDDTNTSGNTDRLMAAISSDPDTVMEFMQKLTSNLYSAIGNKMAATSLSSAFTIYNDKQMQSDYKEYSDLISEWEDRISTKEEYYYSKFSSMESALTSLNSTQSSLSSYFS